MKFTGLTKRSAEKLENWLDGYDICYDSTENDLTLYDIEICSTYMISALVTEIDVELSVAHYTDKVVLSKDEFVELKVW